MNTVIEKWEEILNTVKSEYEVTDVPFNTWLKPLKVYEVDGNLITVIVPSEQAGIGVNYISKRYKIPLQVTICVLTGMEECEVRFVLEKDLPKKNEKNTSYDKQVQDTRYEEAHLNPKYTFDTFVVGSNNKFAQAAALAVAESPGDTYNPLFIYGGAGLGKTHLMQSIAHYILQHNSNMKVLYVSSNQFTNEIIEAIAKKTTEEFRNKYRKVDVLLIDDIQYLIGKDATQNEFFDTFNALHDEGKQIILSSDKPPKEIKTLDVRYRSRFEWGVPIDIHAPDYETRMAILKNKAEIKGLKNISEPIFEYIAKNITYNVRELEGALNKLSIYSELGHIKITEDLAKNILKDLISKDEKVTITPDLIINTVSEHLNISVNDIISTKRSQDIATARQISMYLCRKYTDKGLKSIGDSFGGKDHSTVHSNIQKVEEKIDKDPEFAEMVDVIIKKLNPQK